MLKQIYNKAYQKFTPDFLADQKRVEAYLGSNRESLSKFLTQHQTQFDYYTGDKTVLELGCGLGGLSHWLADRFKSVQAVDISELAISMAKEINTRSNIEFLVADVCELDLDEKFDFIVDSHLFHCLPERGLREKYLEVVKRHLKPEGIFLAEAMVFQEKIQIPVGYSYDQSGILFQEIDGSDIPVRCILPSIEIENEVKNSGLNLNYFYYHHELSFQVFEDYPDYPAQFLPKTVRLSSKLN